MRRGSIIDAAAVETPRERPTGMPGSPAVLVVDANPLATTSFLHRVTTALARDGWETSVASPGRVNEPDVAWYPLPRRLRGAARRIGNLAAYADVVVTSPAALPVIRRSRPRAPVVLLVDEELLGRRARVLGDDRIELAIANSEAVAGPLRWRGIETVVIRAQPSTPVECPRREPAEVIGSAARFSAGAGLDVLLEAFAAVHRPGLELELVNIDGLDDERYIDSLRARAARPDLDGRVRIYEHTQDPRILMRRWRVAVHANVTTDSATSALRDAVALGVPVVATDRGPNAELLGSTGTFVRPGRVDELARALERVLDGANGSGNGNATASGGAGVGIAPPPEAQILDRLREVAARGARRRGGTVVFVVPDYKPTLGGTTRQTHNQARELMARGYDVVVVTQRLEPHWARAEVHNGLRVRRIGPSGRTGLRMKLLVLAIGTWLRRHRDEIAVVNVIMYPDFVVSAALAGVADRTVMCWAGLGDATDTIGGSSPIRAPLRAIRRRALSRAAQVALTPALQHELDDLGLGHDASVIPTPVDITEFRPATADERAEARRALRIDEQDFVIAYTGHLRGLKRVERLVEAFAHLVASGRPARLLLVGSTREDLLDRPTALREQLDRVELRGRIILTGLVSDVRPYLRAADTFVLPSDREGLSNSVLEALASGLPVVAPPSAAGDQVLDETCGIVPETNHPERLFHALTLLADDPDYRLRLAAGARRAAERFALARVVNEYEGLYSRLRWRAAVH
jgi:glycosyltransferase involved in cell wall biosynthesis